MIGLSIYLALVDKVQQFSEENKMIYSRSENERCSLSFSALNIVRLLCFRASLVAQRLKRLPAMRETRVRSLGPVPGLGRSPGEGNGNPLQYSCLENSMDRGAWRATVYGVAKSQTQLSDFTFTLF